ncbi:hypothetical protein AciM339_0801 [Aciduliprofundum sp. MAR08-339]|uniref:hypothetical protein n=1 Tax=Aciduliprofundum sp. (strain MAR08-339) TaxID=673860 RepID=UPI0002A491C7|nr:hypothetical protein AciM339_0801 [Aciduliprofundum sp. MAR08-339]
MNKKTVFITLIGILLIGIMISTSQEFLWGVDTIGGTDELHHFSRAYAIANRWVDPYHEPDNPKFFDFYPAGFHLLLGEFILLSGFTSVYVLYIILKILYFLIPAIIVFLIGTKVDWKVGLLSVFFLATYFEILTSVHNYYIYVSTPQNYLNTNFITITSFFSTILLYLLFIKARDKEIFLGSLITLFGVVHGISHISTYIGYIFNLTSFLIIFFIYFVFKKNFTQSIKMVKLLLYTFLSLPLSFFIYYFPMYPVILNPPYRFKYFWPPFIPQSFLDYAPHIFIISLISIIIILIYLTKFIHYSKYRGYLSFPRISKYIIFIFGLLYIILYLTIVYKVTTNPRDYSFSGFILLAGVFPTYFPHRVYSYISFFSLIVGFLMFILSAFVITFYYKIINKTHYLNYILIMYIIFYVTWFIFAIIIHYYADRIIYFRFLLPLVYSLAIFLVLSFKVFSIGKKKIVRNVVVIGIIFVILSTNVVSQIAKEPSIREEFEIPRPIRGSVSPPLIYSSLAVVTNTLTKPGEYVLASGATLPALATTTHIKLPTYSYSLTYTDHRNWSITINALRGKNMNIFFERYNARYLIIGYGDLTMGRYPWGWHTAPISSYDKNPHLLLIYEGNGGERIYLWIK